MNKFFDENVFLGNDTAKELYKEVKDLPIFDYHCHLSPKEIAEDRRFYDLGELWLEGDHYKWRLMRANGADEELVTGKADYKDKFLAFAEAAENAAGNAVYHWIHLELKKYFGIDKPLNRDTAEEIWNTTKEMMKDGSFSAQKLIVNSNVEAVFTTDDPADSLEYHKALKESGFPVRVSPSCRPDMAVCGITKPEFKAYIEKAENVSGVKIDSIDGMEKFLSERIKFFADNGCKVSDISLTTLPSTMGTKEDADKALKAALSGNTVTEKMASDYTSYLLVFVAKEYKNNDIAQQLHMSALRNNNSNLFAKAGADSGNDSVAKIADIDALRSLLDAMAKNNGLPKTIVYTLNNANYYELATMIGNFWGENGGNLQLGAAWWFCDHLEGIKEQLKMCSATGLLGRFNGMLTDSRSFTSYARHDYFRRILCTYVGGLVENGEFEEGAAVRLVKNVSIENARKFFSIK